MFKMFSFWLPIISIIIIIYNILGYDDNNILLIKMNPVLNEIINVDPYRNWMVNVQENKLLATSYVVHLFTFFIYGLIIDSFIIRFKSKKQRKNRHGS
ncbi:hypothetical protein [Virgibacillus oceani]|uniref:Uncharacterized protein n=1 Tax=Virgibacillus oceani TaxID=1479511 RepID=A0A917HLK7_9BACI|nr:hypothetical protein [Virgibacillus oceani]GGG83495.1 hypothetical protein GCM10011398_31380 [Virgibacillus oceani]